MTERKPKANLPPKLPTVFLLNIVRRVSNSANVSLTDETIDVYVSVLRSHPQAILESACEATIREWTEPSKMPTLAFILERCTRAQLDANTQRVPLSPKPATFQPDDRERRRREAQEIINSLRDPQSAKLT